MEMVLLNTGVWQVSQSRLRLRPKTSLRSANSCGGHSVGRAAGSGAVAACPWSYCAASGSSASSHSQSGPSDRPPLQQERSGPRRLRQAATRTRANSRRLPETAYCANLSFAWMRNRSRCRPMCGRRAQPNRGNLRNKTTNMNAVTQRTYSAPSSPLPARHFTTATPDRSGAEFARLVENIVAQ
jgi:hypothetical protein